jgi:hypothetical protein
MNQIALRVPDIHAAAKQLLTDGMKFQQSSLERNGPRQPKLCGSARMRMELIQVAAVENPRCSEYTGPHPIS